MFTDLKQARVCIVGLGLMGGSLGMALRAQRACRAVIGSDRTPAICQQAIALGAVDEATADIMSALPQADVVILATPVRAIIRLIADLGPRLRAGALLMDIGSTKTAIVEAMRSLPPHVEAVGGHPMCGKEKEGLAAAAAALYEGALFCLTPLERTRPEALSLAGEIVQAIGARPLVVEPQRHDAVVAAISHLPYLMAAALTITAADTADADPLAWQLASSGFRDTSRLAGSDIDMILDILLTNREHVARLAQQAASRLVSLATAIAAGDESALRSTLTPAQHTRRRLFQHETPTTGLSPATRQQEHSPHRSQP